MARDDETYIIDLCDGVLGLTSERNHRFDFLRGDPGKNGKGRTLPVDAYYPSYPSVSLVVEYHEKQHFEPVRFFDKPHKMTVSGCHRGEQRRRYDELRRKVLPAQGIRLVELDYGMFDHDPGKRLRRDPAADQALIKSKLEEVSRCAGETSPP